MSLLNHSDIPLLRSHGFHTSPSGASYFSTDKDGTVWQAAVDDINGLLMFHQETSKTEWTSFEPMEDVQFREMFPPHAA